MSSSLQNFLSKLEKLEEQKIISKNKIENLKNKLKEISKEIETIQSKIKQKTEEKRKIDLEIRQFELLIKEEEEKIRKWENQLRESTKFREQKTLMDEISEAKKEKSKIEDQLLELIFKRDEIENELKKLKEESEKKIESYQHKLNELQNEITNSENEYSEITSKIQILVKELESNFPEIFIHYLEVSRDKRIKKPIAKVERSTCTSCYLVLSPEIEVRLYTNSSYEICPNCGAILYVEIDEEEQPRENAQE